MVGEGGSQIDVLPDERLHSLSGHKEHASHDALAEEGYAQHAAYAGSALERAKGVFLIALGVVNEHGRMRQQDTCAKRPATRLVVHILNRAALLFGETDACHALEIVPKTTMDHGDIGFAQTGCGSRKSIENLL